MRYKIICCNVFKAEVDYLMDKFDIKHDIEFLELGEHARPAVLREKLQDKIDESQDYDAILLLYGLCGTATVGLTACKVPLIIFRSHDCCGVLLGSRKRFEELFSAMPSTPFASIGFANSGDYYFQDGDIAVLDQSSYQKYVELYGEEDAKYIYDAMHPKLDGKLQPIYFIHTLAGDEIICQKCRQRANEEGREFLEVSGNLELIKKILTGDWNDEEFLVVPPNKSIKQIGDWNQIIDCK